jgi:ribose 1,5-bisphosphate isomerase
VKGLTREGTAAVTNATLEQVVIDIRDDRIGGAADMAKAAARAVGAVAQETPVRSADEMAKAVDDAVDQLLAVTPSIAPVLNVLQTAVGTVEETQELGLAPLRDAVLGAMDRYRIQLESALETIAEIGAELVSDGDRIFLYSISTTVWRIFHKAHAQGKRIEVVVTESRPTNEGLWNIGEMGKDGIPVTVGIDAAMGVLLKGCAMMIVGTDAITSTGSALCKIGTFPAAAVAHHLGVPVRIAADISKFDPLSLYGFAFKIREMARTGIVHEDAPNLTVRNPVFDVTPADLITSIITERGIIHPAAAYTIFAGMQQSPRFAKKLRTWVRQRA